MLGTYDVITAKHGDNEKLCDGDSSRTRGNMTAFTTMTMTMMVVYRTAFLLVLSGAAAFSPVVQRYHVVSLSFTTTAQTTTRRRRKRLVLSSSTPGGGGSSNNVERLEFKIYPDGRIEEKV